MSRNLNKVMLIGNAGRDPDLHETASGKKVVHLSLATSRRIGRGEEAEQRTVRSGRACGMPVTSTPGGCWSRTRA